MSWEPLDRALESGLMTAQTNNFTRTGSPKMGNQSPSILVILCLILAALLGSARAEDVPTAAPDLAPTETAPMSPVEAPMEAPMAAPAEAPAGAPAADAPTAEAPSAEAPTAEGPAADAPAAEAPATEAPATSAAAPAEAPAPAVTGIAGLAQRTGPPANCVAEAMSLTGNNAPCASLINSYRSTLASNPSTDDASIKAAVASAPTPSSQCCAAVRTFIEDGCSCNQQLMGLLPMVGVTPAQIQFAIKATQYSSCADSDNGGWINNPCTDSSSSSSSSSSSNTAGRRLLMV
ncbi:hypothetical protein WJX75_001016 [Coccomyxa subellipsoidea]|uniref:Bifunctional inhibitor/plant lipid transfer protein/seed storage helical domain-containing protein n=1 Tax=Coccomyxa subellipsoidea TaxID=248742 RepID=A0ABR2YEI4_9CHLO